ncbi:hypothetical protein Pcinc_026960 [Petrolisthes cinctipes]|uniref:Uncharacterized protein n=1 Tax=Petrolisthes cinctipes TaxID=88211 RepID=A0AAE1F608_PETCI|nr:hypothetical protein Pcinc_026960 [Petrolisthes cinctipes]
MSVFSRRVPNNGVEIPASCWCWWRGSLRFVVVQGQISMRGAGLAGVYLEASLAAGGGGGGEEEEEVPVVNRSHTSLPLRPLSRLTK